MKANVLKVISLLFLLFLLSNQGAAQRRMWHHLDDPFAIRHNSRIPALVNVATDTTFSVVGRWAWGSCEAVEAQGKLAYIGNGPTVQILDISNTASPTIIGEYTTPGYVTDIKVRDSLAYVASGTLQILNVSNPSSPTLLASVNIDLQSIERVAVADSFVYVSGFPGGVFVIDVTNPGSPRVRGSNYPGGEEAECFVARGRFIYFGDHEESELSVLDATNPDSLKWSYSIIDGFATAGFVRDTMLFLGVISSGPTNYLKIFSVAHPDTAIPLGKVEVSNYTIQSPTIVWGLTADSTTAYVTTDSSKVIAIDISNISNPVVTAIYESSPINIWGGRATTKIGKLLLVAQASGLDLFDVSNEALLMKTCSFPTGGRAIGISIKDNMAYIASFFSGLWIVDISDPQKPQSVSNINVGGCVGDVIISDTLAYLADYVVDIRDDSSRGLWIINIADALHPRVLSHYIGIARPDIPDQGNFIAKIGNLIVMTQVGAPLNDTTLEVIDVSNPAQPARVSVFSARYRAGRLAVKDSIAYVATADSGLRMIDLHDPYNPHQLSEVPDYALCIAVEDSFAFMLNVDLLVVDISNVRAPVTIDTTLVVSSAVNMGVAISGNYLYWDNGCVGAVDISNKRKPVPKGTFSYAFLQSGVAASGNTVYFGDEREGMWILRNNLVTEVTRKSGNFTREKPQLLQNYPNPFNPETTIQFNLPRKARLLLEIYDVLGERVSTLVDDVVPAGIHKVAFNGTRLASGVYFCRLTAERITQTRKLVICK